MGEVGRDEHGARGWWGLACWNGLSPEQQRKLIDDGNLEIGYTPAGWCTNGAEVAIETMFDVADGPRFYCRSCAIEYMNQFIQSRNLDEDERPKTRINPRVEEGRP